jgi:acetyltransferase-like isoleucine patch superfamily enzyme
MSSIYRYLATSDHAVARAVRRARRDVMSLSLPAPKPLVVPLRWTYEMLRESYWYGLQHGLCEPYFKSHCKSYGKHLQTGCFFHYISGRGSIVVGDDVSFDGKVCITFAARFSDDPTLEIGDRTRISDQCAFTIGKRITIGADCLIAPGVLLFDSPGHPSDPGERRRHTPPSADAVKPVTVGDNVWIGTRAIVGAGVTIGTGSVISAGAVVLADVAPNTVMAGNPARKIALLQPEGAAAAAPASMPAART